MNQKFYDDIGNIDFQAYWYIQINSLLIDFQALNLKLNFNIEKIPKSQVVTHSFRLKAKF